MNGQPGRRGAAIDLPVASGAQIGNDCFWPTAAVQPSYRKPPVEIPLDFQQCQRLVARSEGKHRVETPLLDRPGINFFIRS